MHVHLRGLYDRSSVRSPIQESEGSRGRNPEQALLSVSQTDNTIVPAAAHGPPRLIFQTVLSMLAMASVYIIFMLLGMQVFRNYHDPSSVRSQSHQQIALGSLVARISKCSLHNLGMKETTCSRVPNRTLFGFFKVWFISKYEKGVVKYISVLSSTRPFDINTPYDQLQENGVVIGAPDKRSVKLVNTLFIFLLYVGLIIGLLGRFSLKLPQRSSDRLQNRKGLLSGGGKDQDVGSPIMFADVAVVDEAKDELEEIVVK